MAFELRWLEAAELHTGGGQRFLLVTYSMRLKAFGRGSTCITPKVQSSDLIGRLSIYRNRPRRHRAPQHFTPDMDPGSRVCKVLSAWCLDRIGGGDAAKVVKVRAYLHKLARIGCCAALKHNFRPSSASFFAATCMRILCQQHAISVTRKRIFLPAGYLYHV